MFKTRHKNRVARDGDDDGLSAGHWVVLVFLIIVGLILLIPLYLLLTAVIPALLGFKPKD